MKVLSSEAISIILKDLESRFLGQKVIRIDYDKLNQDFYIVFENGEEVEI